MNARRVWINGSERSGMLGVYGKHPAFGDFISYGVTSCFQSEVEPWVGQVMAQTRDHLGDRWASTYDTALPLRFWIGANIFGGGDMRGVLLASRDKVGRRYPLVIVQEAPQLPAPVLDKDQSFYDAVQAQLEKTMDETVETATDLVAGLEAVNTIAPANNEPVAESATFWAANPDLQVEGLLDAVSETDRQQATAHRSYWWAAGREPHASVFLATQGLPDSAQMAWLLSGIVAQELVGESILEAEG